MTLFSSRHLSLSRNRFFLPSVLALGLAASASAMAQVTAPVPANVVNIAASGFLEVPQDWLAMTLNTTREGSDAGTVQNQLKQALDAALAIARASAKPQQLEVRTGQFSLYPRYGSNGKINGWQGSTELVLEGRDFALISATAGKIQTLTMSSTSFSLSREARRKLESDVQALAIERFKVRADEVSKGFGFTGYSLREVNVSSADQEVRPFQPRAMAMEAKAAMSDAAVPLEAGKSTVNVTVSGSIQLR
ncbi:SIMPL domain-containing protein [Hydrogenophaga laconesensis]|uniref:Secreted protein n=1 Tax=Hydrogenophaga laconesensis TaxID=1805971 RepID=A0ABU1V5F2_9BURK|nr:putative secreted protein [Hydrogenophaga laconesensis]